MDTASTSFFPKLLFPSDWTHSLFSSLQQLVSGQLSSETPPVEYTSTNCPKLLGRRAQSEQRCSFSKPFWQTALHSNLQTPLCNGWRKMNYSNSWNQHIWWSWTASSSACDFSPHTRDTDSRNNIYEALKVTIVGYLSTSIIKCPVTQ